MDWLLNEIKKKVGKAYKDADTAGGLVSSADAERGRIYPNNPITQAKQVSQGINNAGKDLRSIGGGMNYLAKGDPDLGLLPLKERILLSLPQVPHPGQFIESLPEFRANPKLPMAVQFPAQMLAEATVNTPKRSFQGAYKFGDQLNAGTAGLNMETGKNVLDMTRLPLAIATAGGLGGLTKSSAGAVPVKTGITQTTEQLAEKAGGFAPGVKTAFDTALMTKDIPMLRQLIPSMPVEYIKLFAPQIAKALGQAL